MESGLTAVQRSYGLDVFRAIAIIGVLIGHTFEHSHIPDQLRDIGRTGILGVELFFVLSGFLIGSIILNLIEKQQFNSISDITVFWRRRWFRTLPMYYVALLAFIRFDYHGRHHLLDYPAYFVFVQNLFTPIPDFFGISWSLAIEENFYFWLPLIFLLFARLTRQSRKSLILAAATLIVLSYGYRLSHAVFDDWNAYNSSIRMVVLARLDSLMFGVLMAAVKRYWPTVFHGLRQMMPLWVASFAITCAWWFAGAPGLMQSPALQINLFTIQSIQCALLLPWFDGLHAPAGRRDFFTFTSKISYSLYLLHILVISVTNITLAHLGVFEVFYNNPLVIYPMYFALMYAVAWVSYLSVEKPFLVLRDNTISLGMLVTNSLGAIGIGGMLVFVF